MGKALPRCDAEASPQRSVSSGGFTVIDSACATSGFEVADLLTDGGVGLALFNAAACATDHGWPMPRTLHLR